MRNKLVVAAKIFLALLAVVLFILPSIPDLQQKAESTQVIDGNPHTLSENVPSGHTAVSDIMPSPETLSRFFMIPQRNTVKPEQKETPVEIPQTPTLPASADTWLQFLGIIGDEANIERIYFKNNKTGSVLKIRLDGKEENNIRLIEAQANKYLISIDNIPYSVSGGKK